ncbi:SRPBCC domain-containing protein [Paenibacillus motobuensis]|uniref:SRPBCC family protein n=1 Tax=Paenibacillus TaxID=44249 RepID=UPI00203D7F1C|nr:MULTISPECIES: SRPBCC domain-containing protein [Paenibacillus]MCM3039863.1 SRPBCC domain-containing protein [Paenibacillus lutimineralis]MCM3646967.1 SRPBCC domain-containing protein [Paenibacillus motobuensis]
MDNNMDQKLPDIRHSVLVNAPISKVWSAVSTADGLSAWFMPNDLEAVVGHEFQLNAGPFGLSPCKVTLVEEPNRLSFNWGKDWTLTFELSDREEQTEVTVIHSGWSADQVTEFGQPHTVIRGNMDGGWSGLVIKLKTYLEA